MRRSHLVRLVGLTITSLFLWTWPAAAQTAASATKSTLTASPSTVIANGTATTTLTVTAKSATGATLRNVVATFAATGTNNVFSPAFTATTDNRGVATVTLKSTTAEKKTISVTLGGVAVNQKPVVTFTAPPVPARVAFSTQPKTTNTAGAAISVAVKATTSTGAAVAGVPVTISLAGSTVGAVLGGTLTATTASTGIATFSGLTVTKAGTGYTIAASAGTLTATSTAFSITASTNSLGATGKSTLVALGAPFTAGGTPASIVATITDAYLNPKPNVTVTFTTTGGTLSTGSAATNAAGQATVTLTSAVSGNFTVTAKVATATVALPVAVAFLANVATRLVFTSQPTTGTAGQALAAIVISALNVSSGAAPLPGPVTIALASAPPGTVLSGVLTQTPATGATSLTFTGLSVQVAGAVTLRAASGALWVDAAPIQVSAASLPPSDLVPASGGVQVGGVYQNQAVVLEPVPATTIGSATGNIELRTGFLPSGSTTP